MCIKSPQILTAINSKLIIQKSVQVIFYNLHTFTFDWQYIKVKGKAH